MLKIVLSGAGGKMGKMVADCIKDTDGIEITAGVDLVETKCDFPFYTSFNDVKDEFDVLIDFSNAKALDGVLEFAKKNNLPCVLCTTGYKQSQIEQIKDFSNTVPVFRSANMSLGVNLICNIAKQTAKKLGLDYDIEIVEKHHNQKLDSPSGTALMIADSINEECGKQYMYEYDRHSKRAKRTEKEIGIHSVRGGTIVGEHDVIFAGKDEVITLSHTAQSREIFARGAISAAKFIHNKKAGLYDMNNLINE